MLAMYQALAIYTTVNLKKWKRSWFHLLKTLQNSYAYVWVLQISQTSSSKTAAQEYRSEPDP